MAIFFLIVGPNATNLTLAWGSRRANLELVLKRSHEISALFGLLLAAYRVALSISGAR